MKVVILAGGLGTRIAEETSVRPKPMVEIGGKPILWHIMKIYSSYGFNDFIICLGYKGYVIKEFFANYFLHTSDVKFDLVQNKMEILSGETEPWKVTLIDTGSKTQTGGRLKRVRDYLGDEEFCFTYGDGLADVDIHKLVESHRKSGKLATVTAVRPPGRFGILKHNGNNEVISFKEKPDDEIGLINGGFFVLSPKVIDYIDGDDTIWERYPMHNLVSDGKMGVYVHKGFWQPMDTLGEKIALEKQWKSGAAPWKVWCDGK